MPPTLEANAKPHRGVICTGPRVARSSRSRSSSACRPQPAPHRTTTTSRRSRRPSRSRGIYEHLNAFQAHADANGDNRFAGLPGHDASAQYVYDRADRRRLRRALPGVRVRRARGPLGPDEARAARRSSQLNFFQDFIGARTSVNGDVTAHARRGRPEDPVDRRLDQRLRRRPTSPASPQGRSRSCSAGPATSSSRPPTRSRRRQRRDHHERGQHARPPGLDFNPNVTGTTIPVIATTFAAGLELATASRTARPATTVRVKVDFFRGHFTTRNVIADSQYGATDNTLVVGAHLDSVLDGPGIQDNGSGLGGDPRDRRADGEGQAAQPRALHLVQRRGVRPDRVAATTSRRCPRTSSARSRRC